MEFLKRFGVFVGWLSGSVAGLAALLYAIGFIATLANLSVLGVDFFLIGYDSVFFIARGANAILYLALALGDFLLLIAPVFVIVPPLVLGVRALHQRLAGHRSHLGERTQERLRQGALALAYLGLLAYLYFALHRYVGEFSAYASIAGLLFNPAGAAAGKGALALPALCSADIAQGRLRVLMVVAAGAAVVTLLAIRITRGWRFRGLLLTPFVVILVIFAFLLPATYGALLVQRSLAPVRITAPSATTPRDYDLISKTGSEFVLWDPAEKRVVWMPASAVSIAAIGHKEPLSTLLPGLRTLCQREDQVQ